MKLFNTSAKLLGIIIASIFIGCQQKPKKEETLVIQGNIMADTIWTADKNYVLDQQVTVPSGVTLTIEPGTVIKANAGEAPNVSMLVIARGGKIMAKGTAEQPSFLPPSMITSTKKMTLLLHSIKKMWDCGVELSSWEMLQYLCQTVMKNHFM